MNFERIVVVRNPVSTHAERAAKYIAQLRAYYPNVEVTVIKTVRGGITANETRLREHADLFGPATLVGVVAGDGTFNMIVTILMRLGGLAPQAALLPLWGGNANDLAHMLNGRAPRSLAMVLQRAQPVVVRPLECRLTLPDGGSETRLALCYASFGASAAVARRLGEVIRSDHPSHVVPGVRFMREMGSAWRTLKRSPLFAISEAGAPRHIFEGAFYNGPRFAKVSGLPLKLTDEHFFGTLLATRNRALLLLHISRLRSRRHAPKFRRRQVSFTVAEDVTAQFDGETVAIASGTHVSIALATAPLKLIALRDV